MSNLYNSLPITSCCRTICDIMGVDCGDAPASANAAVKAMCQQVFSGRKADRALLYNPDAIALWLYQNYTHLFTDAMVCSRLAIPMLSVMPSVTPVCFASMYTGLMPDGHGIKKYVKPVLTVDTVFDHFIRAGKKCAIVSTAGDSISQIFLDRSMDYFIFDTMEEVNLKALELIEQDAYDLLVVYNVSYDATMHHHGPEAPETMEALKDNIWTYRRLVEAVEEHWQNHDVLYGFLPDHGCHQIDKNAGSHGLDMEEDMNVIHFYGAKPRKEGC